MGKDSQSGDDGTATSCDDTGKGGDVGTSKGKRIKQANLTFVDGFAFVTPPSSSFLARSLGSDPRNYDLEAGLRESASVAAEAAKERNASRLASERSSPHFLYLFSVTQVPSALITPHPFEPNWPQPRHFARQHLPKKAIAF